MKKNHPADFQFAVDFEKSLRDLNDKNNRKDIKVFLHRQCIPLDEIDFESKKAKIQDEWDFQNECEGMCGV